MLNKKNELLNNLKKHEKKNREFNHLLLIIFENITNIKIKKFN